MKKFSILGFVLATASVVTAAFIPSNASGDDSLSNGKIKVGTAGEGFTCTANLSGSGAGCIYNTVSAETSANNNTSLVTTQE